MGERERERERDFLLLNESSITMPIVFNLFEGSIVHEFNATVF